MSNHVLYQDNAREALQQGINILSQVVSVTLGPKGRNVVLDKRSIAPQIVNDGATIVKEIDLDNHMQNIGVSLIRQAALKTNDVAGDGTTTATVLAHAIIRQGLISITAGANPMELKKGIEQASKFVACTIGEIARPVRSIGDIMQIASISAGNDSDIGKMIADAIQRVGKEGIITLEQGKSTTNELEITEGMCFEKGFISPYFITDISKFHVVHENPYVLVTDKTFSTVQHELIPILEQVSEMARPLFIVAEDICKEALSTMIANKLRGIIDISAVRAPGFGDDRKVILEDIAILTGATVISEEVGLSLSCITLDMLGQARRVTITKNSTVIIAEDRESVESRCSQIYRQFEVSTDAYEKEKLQQRLSRLSGGAAIIKIGASTETEMQDKRLRLEDAINATRSAIEEGIVPGGGAALFHVSHDLSCWSQLNLSGDQFIGAMVVQKALSAPLEKIVDNAGANGAVIAQKLASRDSQMGFDVVDGSFVDMFATGIIDPAKVARSALQNASSIASIVLTTDCVIDGSQRSVSF